MHGKNPIRPPVKHDGSTLDVQSLFPTLQGEGPFAGHPAVFIRLGGCNLACSFCDTEFEDFRPMTVQDIATQAGALSRENGKRLRHLAVITGGEPLRQNIAPLCEALLAMNLQVQIETNGTLWRLLPPGVSIVCSPKNAGGGYYPIREDLLPHISAFKFIIARSNPLYNAVADLGQSKYATPVYVQPMDEYDEKRNADNMALALELATKHGYRLSLQMHKLLGIA